MGAQVAGRRGGVLEEQVVLEMQRTSGLVLREVARLLRPAGLSPAQYAVLRVLDEAGGRGLSCRAVSARLTRSDPDLTRLLDRLERRGLVARARAADDRRVVVTCLTARGRGVVREVESEVSGAYRSALGPLGPRRLKALLTLLGAVAPGAGRGEASP